ncbi:hypothetical protein BCR44DRAFT_194252 [Catenaria anguillulae PL171]|uniref:Uncharacterized protein n=1 Tax=Catenaria anguillulae PL171 TaxID=765915 RepID=A0A1Y2HR12_9FUNG|nr:hypothetical protein BCR44DRAFT_194252 [Catenaria anguillulae PL171]
MRIHTSPVVMSIPTPAKHVTLDSESLPDADTTSLPVVPTDGTTDDKYTLQYPPPDYTDPDDPVVVLSLHKGHTIRFTGMDDLLAQALCAAAAAAWPAGVKESRWSGGLGHMPRYFKLKLNGLPFLAGQRGGGDPGFVPAQRIMGRVLRTLLEYGWKVEGMGDCVTHRWGSVASLVLMRAEPRVVETGDMVVIAFDSKDEMWLVDAPTSVEEMVLRTVTKYWTQGIKGVSNRLGTAQFKLHGMPWLGSDGSKSTIEDVAACALMARIMYRLKGIGYSLYATIDISNDKEPPSWVFLRS